MNIKISPNDVFQMVEIYDTSSDTVVVCDTIDIETSHNGLYLNVVFKLQKALPNSGSIDTLKWIKNITKPLTQFESHQQSIKKEFIIPALGFTFRGCLLSEYEYNDLYNEVTLQFVTDYYSTISSNEMTYIRDKKLMMILE